MEPNIELAKPRDFGEIIGDTFLFIRQNIKGLLVNFFVFCGFFMVASAISLCIVQIRMAPFTRGVTFGQRTEGLTFDNIEQFALNWVLLVIFGIATVCANLLVVVCYIALYKQKGNVAPTSEEIWGFFKYYFFRVFFSIILLSILLMAGYMVCLLPGIWLFPILGLIVPVMVIENGSFGYAFGRAFKLVSNNWWITAGTVFVIWLIAYFMMMIISIPASAVNVISMLTNPAKAANVSTGYIIFSAVLQQLMQVFFMIPTIGICLCYFNLAETKEGTSLLGRIDQFGQQTTRPDLPSEEY